MDKAAQDLINRRDAVGLLHYAYELPDRDYELHASGRLTRDEDETSVRALVSLRGGAQASYRGLLQYFDEQGKVCREDTRCEGGSLILACSAANEALIRAMNEEGYRDPKHPWARRAAVFFQESLDAFRALLEQCDA